MSSFNHNYNRYTDNQTQFVYLKLLLINFLSQLFMIEIVHKKLYLLCKRYLTTHLICHINDNIGVYGKLSFKQVLSHISLNNYIDKNIRIVIITIAMIYSSVSIMKTNTICILERSPLILLYNQIGRASCRERVLMSV